MVNDGGMKYVFADLIKRLLFNLLVMVLIFMSWYVLYVEVIKLGDKNKFIISYLSILTYCIWRWIRLKCSKG